MVGTATLKLCLPQCRQFDQWDNKNAGRVSLNDANLYHTSVCS